MGPEPAGPAILVRQLPGQCRTWGRQRKGRFHKPSLHPWTIVLEKVLSLFQGHQDPRAWNDFRVQIEDHPERSC